MDVSLGILHDVIQVAFGWENSHLHQFLVGKIRFDKLDDEAESDLLVAGGEGAPVAAVGSQCLYTYDFGHDREHDVVVERVVDNGGEGITRSGAGSSQSCERRRGSFRSAAAPADPAAPPEAARTHIDAQPDDPTPSTAAFLKWLG